MLEGESVAAPSPGNPMLPSSVQTVEPRPPAPATAPPGEEARSALLARLVESSSGLVGQPFLERMVQDLGAALGVRYLFVGEVLEKGHRARSLALAVDGVLTENFEYPLADTPCCSVADGRPCFIEDSAAALYPGDPLLAEMGVESYFGFPLTDGRGEAVGLVVALHDAPLRSSQWMRTLFQLFAARAGAELGRMRAEDDRVRRLHREQRLLTVLNRLALAPELHHGEVEAFADRATRHLLETVGGASVALWLGDGRDGVFTLRARTTVMRDPIPLGTTLRVGLDHFTEDRRLRFVSRDTEKLSAEVRHFIEERGIREWVEAAVRVGREVAGVLTVLADTPERHWSDGELAFMADVADLLARCVMEARSLEAERRRQALELELERSRKMEALGSLAGGMAHDFNNILGAMLGNAELARMDASGEQLEVIDEILGAGRHARELVGQIFQFAHGESVEAAPLDIPVLVEETLRTVRPLAGGTELACSVAGTLPAVEGDAGQLRQALLNLCTNALNALGGAGRLEVVARAATPQEVAAHPALPTVPHLLLQVADDGPGIPEEHRARLFEPFFTTRKGKGGNGLGLAIVDRVVRGHGGWVGVETAEGEGTTFSILLPARGEG